MKETDQPATELIPELTIQEVKERILKVIRSDSMSTAAGLEKAELWERENEKVLLTFNSPFASTLVEKEFNKIEKIILDKLGWKIQFSTKIKREETVQNETIEEQVELVRSVFRGTII